MQYDVVKRLPVCRMYYKGNHSHPVRRTVLVIQATPKYIRGYELREGSEIRPLAKAPVKTYRRSRIARQDQLGANKHRQPGPPVTTLERQPLWGLVAEGA